MRFLLNKKGILVSFSVISIVALYMYSKKHMEKTVSEKTIKLVLHAGLRKTGSSALQNFFVNNVDALKKQGILYPNVVPQRKIDNSTVGNAWNILKQHKENPNFFKDTYNEALRSNCHTVILSSELMTTEPEELYKILKQYPQFDTHVILYVREIYSYQWSYYQQKMKRCAGDYYSYKDIILPLDLKCWLDSSFKDQKLIVSNFDVHKKDIVSNFFNKLGIPVNFDVLVPIEITNRSLTESEHNIIDSFWQKGRGGLTLTMSKSFLSRNPNASNFRYYDPVFAQKLYEHDKGTIEKVNRLLADDEKLPLQPHQPKGYTTTWNKNNIDPNDIQIVIDAFNLKEFFDNSPFKKFCPKDFDMSAYFAKNLDLFVEEKNPYEHYYENHVKVNR